MARSGLLFGRKRFPVVELFWHVGRGHSEPIQIRLARPRLLILPINVLSQKLRNS
jgi:hypothetical protein